MSAVISSAGRNRMEILTERNARTPKSKKPFQNSSRVSGSGRSKARNSPRPRAAEMVGSSRCSCLKSIQKIRAYFGGVFNQVFFLDDLKIVRRTHHVGEVSAPGRIQPAGKAKCVVLYFVQPRTSHDATHLRFFPKREQIWQNVEVFAAPVAAGHGYAALHFVKDQKDLVLIANRS